MQSCPLCKSATSLATFYRDSKRSYVQCRGCELVSVNDQYLLSSEAEKAQYDLHQNNPNDLGYQKFLSRAFNPLLKRISLQSEGLDFGCGPGPTISVMARQQGIKMSNFDPFYYPDKQLLTRQYDFITMTEVIEHVRDTQQVLRQLETMLKTSGNLVIMTKRLLDLEHFKSWHYKNDPTHIRFFSVQTFEVIAAKFNFSLDIIDDDVVIFTKLEKNNS